MYKHYLTKKLQMYNVYKKYLQYLHKFIQNLYLFYKIQLINKFFIQSFKVIKIF